MSHSEIGYNRAFKLYFKLSYLMILIVCFGFSSSIRIDSLKVFFFVASMQVVYSFVYMLPSLILCYFIKSVFNVFKAKHRLFSWYYYKIAIVSIAITNFLIILDFKIYHLFGFHINSFVINLATTKGGIQSMGAGTSSYVATTLLFVLFVLIQSLLLFLSIKMNGNITLSDLSKRYKLSLLLPVFFIICLVFLIFTWGISQIKGETSILSASTKFPFYQPVTIRSFVKKTGYKIQERKDLKLSVATSSLSYPLNKLKMVIPEKKLNIVWLVSESWRADMLDSEIMPATYKFSQKACNFTNHYSGGNGTRMGIFTMFYGLYGSYWFRFLNENRSPVIMDILQEQGYQFDMFTSALFSYPELDKTVFSNIAREKLHESNGCGGFINDRKNVSSLIDFIDKRDKKKPFMTFMFFESPHAPYTFPKECVVKKDYLSHINYALVNVGKEIKKIKNRYINSCNHLDTQFKRIFDYLKKESLLEDTIVIVTGDHGEEFMEKGRWGHNSEFHQEQLRVPLILWIPGQEKKEYSFMSSHLDISATIIPMLGVKNPLKDYSLGYNLFADKRRDFTVCSSWTHIGFINKKFKYSLPLKYSLVFPNRLTTKDDRPLKGKSAFLAKHQKYLFRLMKEMGVFYKKQ